MKKILLGLALSVSLFAIDKTNVVSQLECQSFSFNENMAGLYKYYNSATKDWVLYMPSLKYIIVHETGKSKTSDGAEVLSESDFETISANANVQFGAYIGSNDRAIPLSNQTYNVNDQMTGIYKLFNQTEKLWFLYMPDLNYLIVHETGKTLVSDGALVINVNDEFNEITVTQDPFGNTTGDITFVAKSGCETASSSSSEAASSSSSEAASSSSSEAASSSSSEAASSSSSEGSIEQPPEPPEVGSSASSIEAPPSIPTF